MESGRFTSKSDVWSFGVTMWEVFADMKVPYGELGVCVRVPLCLSVFLSVPTVFLAYVWVRASLSA